MKRKSYLLTLFSIVFTALAVTNCSMDSMQQTTQISHDNPFVDSADNYLARARNAEAEEKNGLKLKAAGRLISDRQIQDGVRILKNLSPHSRILQDEKHLLMAKANMMVNQPKRASYYLTKVQHSDQLSPFYQNLYRKLLIENYEQKGRVVEALEERIKLDFQLQSADEKIANYKHIWFDLIQMPKTELQTLAIEANNQDIQGWASLALIAQRNDVTRSISMWQSANPNHQANQLLRAVNTDMFPKKGGKKIALLLPLSGSLSGPGHAIKDGFTDAKSQFQHPVLVQTYDVAKGSVLEQYDQAIKDGADMVIGPLSKDNVDLLANQNHPIPTLFLNFASSTVSENAWEFGLSPNYEASQLAEKLSEQGFHKAILIAPKGGWGEQVKSAFTQQWIGRGNAVVDELIVAKDTQYNEEIRRFLHIDSSAVREKALKGLLGRGVKGNLRRREDFDVVVLLTRSSKARQIVPLLKYYYLGDTPVYGLSTIHAADLRVADNRDLDDVIFPDVAYIYQRTKSFPRNWPEKLNSYNRLFAIGRDSFLISQKLEKILLFPAVNLREGDDTVYLSTPTHITYKLHWGTFVEGKAQRIG